ncbi:MAG: tetratricopeptide repeat protein [Ktedonobacteraceae bacterium]|nr:tetratricopeptide repeat protein [Ktedonobacteraceae bacterium]
MSQKKETDVLLSQGEASQLHHVLEHYHDIAMQLHATRNQDEAQVAVNAINTLSQATQIALLKALSKENNTDAADTLAAMNVLGQNKDIRKEARRCLIRLESAKVFPQWTPPHIPAVQVNSAHPPRFWKGVVTQSREEGEVQLVLAWEQGYDYGDVRTMVFLLDFWQDGIKDAIIEISSKRQAERRIEEMRTKLVDLVMTSCTLAEGKRLIEEAYSVNQWRGTTPHKEYRDRLPLINQLILQANDLDEDHGLTFIRPDLEDEKVMMNFLGAWSLGDYGLAYDLLTAHSNLREGLERDEWIERRRAWANEAHPARIELGFVHQSEQSQSVLWLPTPLPTGHSSSKQIEAGWSLELTETPLSGTLREMPLGTAVNKETGRHWFWTSYTLRRENEEWRIQSAVDEGARIQGLSIAELQQRIQEYEAAIEALVNEHEANIETAMEDLSWRLTQLLHYYDALIVRLPFDYNVSVDAYTRALVIGNPELTMVYVERLVTRFAERRGEMLRGLGATLSTLAYKYDTQFMQQRHKHLLVRAEATLRESIVAENSAMGHILLAELLIDQNRNDEAEAEMLVAKELRPNPREEASIEAGLGNIAMRRELMGRAITHYQNVTELDPHYAGSWFHLGFAHYLLGHFAEAEAAYQRAIVEEPDDIGSYSQLIGIHMKQGHLAKARESAEQGLRNNPDSADLHALLASVLSEMGEVRDAEREIAEAEQLNAELDIVKSVREYINRSGSKKR